MAPRHPNPASAPPSPAFTQSAAAYLEIAGSVAQALRGLLMFFPFSELPDRVPHRRLSCLPSPRDAPLPGTAVPAQIPPQHFQRSRLTVDHNPVVILPPVQSELFPTPLQQLCSLPVSPDGSLLSFPLEIGDRPLATMVISPALPSSMTFSLRDGIHFPVP